MKKARNSLEQKDETAGQEEKKRRGKVLFTCNDWSQIIHWAAHWILLSALSRLFEWDRNKIEKGKLYMERVHLKLTFWHASHRSTESRFHHANEYRAFFYFPSIERHRWFVLDLTNRTQEALERYNLRSAFCYLFSCERVHCVSTTVDVDIFIVQRPFIPSSLFSYSFFESRWLLNYFSSFSEKNQEGNKWS